MRAFFYQHFFIVFSQRIWYIVNVDIDFRGEIMKKLISLFTVLVIIFLSFPFTAKAESSAGNLKFRADGTFRIVVFADCQDDYSPDSRMINFMGTALDNEKPDLVVFTGDNVVESSISRFTTGLQKLLQPLISRNIPYAYTLGNHDAEQIDKAQMHDVYMSLGRCMTYNADDRIYGYGNCNIPIYSHDGTEMLFNLWMLDTGSDSVHYDQLDWFKRTDKAIEEAQGHKINSLVFQHIIMRECVNFLTKATSSLSSTRSYNGIEYAKKLNSNAFGYLGEFPCPGGNSGEFDALRGRGDVLGIVTGHDHSNSFVGRYDGIDFIQTPGMSFASYGDTNCRGYRVIELNENNPSAYSTHTVKYSGAVDADYSNCYAADNRYFNTQQPGEYISEIEFFRGSSFSSVKSAIEGQGYTAVDYNLNEGSGGEYICMGYRTTTSYDNALKDIRFYSNSKSSSLSTASLAVNGVKCRYTKENVDLNAGAGGDYIYCFTTKDAQAGGAIKSIGFTDNLLSTDRRFFGTIESALVPADLNKGTSGHTAVYCFGTTADEIDLSRLKDTYFTLKYKNILSSYSASSKRQLSESIQSIESFLKYADTVRGISTSDTTIEMMISEARRAFAQLTVCDVSGGYIYGLQSAKTASAALSYFNREAAVSVEPSSEFVGTNSAFTFSYEDSQLSRTLIIRGDIDGDSFYDAQDSIIAECLANGMLTQADTGYASYLAADCNKDSLIDGSDCEQLNAAGIGRSEISQKAS